MAFQSEGFEQLRSFACLLWGEEGSTELVSITSSQEFLIEVLRSQGLSELGTKSITLQTSNWNIEFSFIINVGDKPQENQQYL